MIECPVDEFVPLPTAPAGSVGYADLRRRAQAACLTAVVMEPEGYVAPTPNTDAMRVSASAAVKTFANGQDIPLEHARALTRTTAEAVFINEILSKYDMEIVHDSRRVRNYVTNKLLLESENNDPRIRMRALELLGKLSDVGLFTERTEVTVTNRSTVELENTLRDKVRRLLNKDAAEDVVYVEPIVAAKPSAAEALRDL